MKVYKLLENEQAATGFTHRIRITSADLTEATANTAQTIAIFTVAARDYISDCAYNLVEAFADSADAALNTTTCIIGDDGDTARYIVSVEMNVNGTEIIAGPAVNAKVKYVYTAANTIDAIFGSMAAKTLLQLDTGKLDVFLKVIPLPAYSGT